MANTTPPPVPKRVAYKAEPSTGVIWYSALLPGLGELFQRRWLVGIIFFTITVVCTAFAILRIYPVFTQVYGGDLSHLEDMEDPKIVWAFKVLTLASILSIADTYWAFRKQRKAWAVEQMKARADAMLS